MNEEQNVIDRPGRGRSAESLPVTGEGVATDPDPCVRAVAERLQSLPGAQPSRALYPRIMAQLTHEARREACLRPLWTSRTLVPAAAALLLLLGGLWAWRTPDPAVPGTELAHQAAVWLQGVQTVTGEWPVEQWGGHRAMTPALSGLAMLAIASENIHAGHALQAGLFRGSRYLLSMQQSDGRIGPVVDGSLYNHALGTAGLLAAWQHVQNEALANGIQRALDYLCSLQAPEGGWGYPDVQGRAPTAASSVWPLQVLAMAHETGWTLPGPHLQRGLRWLASLQDPQGDFHYRTGDRPAGRPDVLNAMAAFCLLQAGRDYPQLMEQRTSLQRLVLDRKGLHDPSRDLYGFFFVSRVLQDTATEESRRQLVTLRQRLAPEHSMPDLQAGHWPVDRWSRVGGQIYSAAMLSLALRNDV